MSYENELLLKVLNGEKVERPPVWIMRQAGRILPGYRKIRASVSGFKELVKSPDLIAEVTIEPLNELGVDAAILFSDILVIPEAMGLDYELVEKKGPVFPSTIKCTQDIDQLRMGEEVLDHLAYVFESITKTKQEIAGRVPLIGFAGAPWTLFAYMIEGSGSKTFSKARRFLYERPRDSHRLLEKLTESLIKYLQQKIDLGCDVVQLFDSWAEILTVDQYKEFALPYVRTIFESIDGPRIFFPKGAWSVIPLFDTLDIEALSIDWKTPPAYVRSLLGDEIVLQGNLDPAFLYAPLEAIENEVNRKIREFGGNFIFNLGHGVYPDTDKKHVEHLIQCIKQYRYQV